MLHLATAADEAYAPGLWVMAASALRMLSASEEVTFHILDGGLAPDSIKQLELLCTKSHQRCSLIFYQIDLQKFETWRPGPNNSKMTYARLLLGSLVAAQKVIYLDADMVVLSDLSQLWHAPMRGMMALACLAVETSKLGDDCPWPLAPGEEKWSYVNGGVMLFDLDKWRFQKIGERAESLIQVSYGNYRFHDQTVLNYLLRGQIGLLPSTWNWQARITSMDQAASINIVHFITARKPWCWWSGDLRFNFWRSCYEVIIGSPLKLFLQRGALNGFFYGMLEIQLRLHPWLRLLYLRWLTVPSVFKKSELSAKVITLRKYYYAHGQGSSLGDDEYKKNKPLIKFLLKRLHLE